MLISNRKGGRGDEQGHAEAGAERQGEGGCPAGQGKSCGAAGCGAAGRGRRRALIAGGAITVVLAVVAALIVGQAGPLTRTRGPGGDRRRPSSRRSPSVPAATFNAVGAGTATGLKATSGQPELTLDGKPEVLYMGGEYCPYCAAERWAMAAALSRFGTLSGAGLHPLLAHRRLPQHADAVVLQVQLHQQVRGLRPGGVVRREDGRQHPVRARLPAAARRRSRPRCSTGTPAASFPFVDIGNQYLVPRAQYLPVRAGQA